MHDAGCRMQGSGPGRLECFYQILGVICRLIVQQVAKNAMSEKWIFGYVTLFTPISIHNGSALLSTLYICVFFACQAFMSLLGERVKREGRPG